ncbi:MAG TPA: hypothetical protein PKI60_08080 [Oscillospiraceae bacterium]|nr:hypothetical protein [Oscillospiraceae bacterium]
MNDTSNSQFCSQLQKNELNNSALEFVQIISELGGLFPAIKKMKKHKAHKKLMPSKKIALKVLRTAAFNTYGVKI